MNSSKYPISPYPVELSCKHLTRTKFAELDPGGTVLQRWIPPSITYGGADESFKTDFRLFVYRERILGISARIYRGQVTNLRTEHGGFAKVRLVH